MSEARKRKLHASLSRSVELPESLRFVPSSEPPTNGPHVKKQKTKPVGLLPLVNNSSEIQLLNLQAEQLIRATRCKTGEDDNLVKLVSSVVKAIETIQDTGMHKLADIRRLSEKIGVTIPFESSPPDDLQLNFQYSKPTAITQSGLSSLGVQPRTADKEAELLIQVPASIIQEKDYLNHRLHYKLAFYLFTIARSMKSKYTLSYVTSLLFGVKSVALKIKYKDRHVLVHLVISPDLFDENKLDPLRNADRTFESATPQYNASVLLRIHLSRLYDVMREASISSPAYIGSILLAHKFLSKRSLPVTVDQWSLITALLLTGGGKNGGKVLSPNASALQLFRGTVLFLSQFFSNKDERAQFDIEQTAPGCWAKNFNVFASITEQERCILAYVLADVARLLSGETIDPVEAFSKVFLDNQEYLGNWDLEFHILDSESRSSDTARLWRTLQRALDKRACLISVSREPMPSDEPINASRDRRFSNEIRVRIMLRNPECQATMVLGPAADGPDAKSFRAFWGQLAELRKFKDGRILESVLLSTSNPTLDACQKIIGLHFKELPGLASWFVVGADDSEDKKLVGTQQSIAAEFDEFARQARDLSDLPLRIISITSNDSVIATCDLTPPIAISGIIQYESSARWPDDLEAIQRTKVAFLLAMRKPFTSISDVTGVEVMLEENLSQNKNISIHNLALLNVTMISGIQYHLRIKFDRERALLSTGLNSATVKSDPALRRHYQAAIHHYEQKFVLDDLHAQQLRNSKSEYPALAETIILVKRWFAAHLLSSCFNDRIIELITLSIFTSGGVVPSQSPGAAFYRIMKFLADWDWRLDPLITTREIALRKEQAEEFRQHKITTSAHGPVIYAPYKTAHLSVERTPALRMTSLAKESHNKLQAGDNVDATYITPLNYFDFVIHLHEVAHKSKHKNLVTTDLARMKLNQLFFEDLSSLFQGNLCLFYAPGESKIAVFVDPAVTQSRRFKPNLDYATQPIHGGNDESGQQVVFDLDATVSEIQRLGEGLIRKVERKDKHKSSTAAVT